MLSSENINAMQQLPQKNEEQRHVTQITDQLSSVELESSFSFFDATLHEISNSIFGKDPAEIAKTIFRPSRPRMPVADSHQIEQSECVISLNFDEPTEITPQICHHRTNSSFEEINGTPISPRPPKLKKRNPKRTLSIATKSNIDL